MPTLEWIGKDKVVNHHQMVFQTKQPDYLGASSLERFMEIVKGL